MAEPMEGLDCYAIPEGFDEKLVDCCVELRCAGGGVTRVGCSAFALAASSDKFK